MKHIFFPLLLLLFSQSLSAQKVSVDSLLNVWDNLEQPDTSRLKAIKTVSWDVYLFTQPDSALHYAQLHFDFAKSIDDQVNMADAINTLGAAYTLKGDFNKAVEHYKKSLTISKSVDDKSGLANTFNNIGNVYNYQGKFDEALEYYQKSLELREGLDNKKGIASSLNNIGSIYESRGDYEKALNYNLKSLKIKLVMGNQRRIAGSYNNIGNIYRFKGEYSEAIEYYNKSFMIYKEIDYKKGVAICSNNLGKIDEDQGDYKSALANYSKSLKYRKEIGNKLGIATALGSVGNIYLRNGKLDTAENYYRESLKLFEELDIKQGIASVMNNLGLIYKRMDDYSKSLEFYNKGLKIRTEIGDKKGIANVLTYLSSIYFNQGYYMHAQDSSLKAFDIANEINAPKELRKASRQLLIISLTNDSIQDAIKFSNKLYHIRIKDLKINFPTLSENQKELYFATMQEDFDLLYDLALHSPSFTTQAENAFDNALLTKGLLLKSSTAIRNAILSSGDSLLTEQYFNWLALKRRIAKAYAQGADVSKMEERANELEKRLVKGSQEFSDFRKVQKLSWKDVQSGLKEGETAIEFVRFTHQEDYRKSDAEKLYAALIINAESEYPKMVRLFKEKELEKILGTFPGNNLSYIEQLYGSSNNTKTQLYNLIWKPMEEELGGSKKVYVSPVGLLHKISFAALAKEQDVYLCDLYDVEMKSSSGKIVQSDDVAFSQQSSMTVFGGVEYNSDSTETEIWQYLEGSLTEAEMIRKTVKKREVNYLTGDKASEENFKKIAPQSNIFHIATHGFFYPDPETITEELQEDVEHGEDLAFRGGRTGFGVASFVKNKNPLMRSGLALAGANDVWNRTQAEGEDGVLTAAEVATIDMRNTDLVVLSACETGLGDIKGSEGVYGLQRSFKMAGVNYLIMSLWQVPDKETAEFMELFYKNLVKIEDIPKAFNKTQKAMRKKYDPYYWGAFILIE